MDFLDRLRHLAAEKGYENNMQLSKASGVPYTTLDGFYRTGYENAKLSTLKKLADCLECSLEYLVNGNPSASDQPTSAALDIARKFDQLCEYSQKVITALVDLELKRPRDYASEVERFNNMALQDRAAGSIESTAL